MWSRKELKARAIAVLKGSYWKAFLVSLIIGLVGGNTGGGFNFATQAELYLVLRQKALDNGLCSYEELQLSL